MQINLKEKPKTYVVINPVAGVSKLETVRGKIESALQEHDIPFEIYETTEGDDLGKKVRAAIDQGFQLFIAAGGDGTLSGVIDGLANTNVPLVIVPTGTWNALAQILEIPLQIDQAIDLLFNEHTVRQLDAMQVGQKFYMLNVSVGVGARTMDTVKREEKRRMGRFADLWRGINLLLEFRSYRYQVKIDGRPAKFRASELMVANAGNLGIKALQIDPNIRMDDGKVNVCRIYANTVGEYLRLAVSILAGEGNHRWNILNVEAFDEVEISTNRRLPVQGDGEVIGHVPVTIKVSPGAVHIVTPVVQDK